MWPRFQRAWVSRPSNALVSPRTGLRTTRSRLDMSRGIVHNSTFLTKKQIKKTKYKFKGLYKLYHKILIISGVVSKVYVNGKHCICKCMIKCLLNKPWVENE